MRNSPAPELALQETLLEAIVHKPEKHDFDLADEPQILRFMSVTGG